MGKYVWRNGGLVNIEVMVWLYETDDHEWSVDNNGNISTGDRTRWGPSAPCDEEIVMRIAEIFQP